MQRADIFGFLVMIDRVSALLLVPLMGVFFATGFSVAGWYGFQNMIDAGFALYLHVTLAPLLLVLFILHAGTRLFFLGRRWTRRKG